MMDYRITLVGIGVATVALVFFLVSSTKPLKPDPNRTVTRLAPTDRDYPFVSGARGASGDMRVYVDGSGVGGGGTTSPSSYLNSNGGTGSTWSNSVNIVSDREPMTRKVMRAMGGNQPTNEQWASFFMRVQGGVGYPTELYNRMVQAHEVAKRFDLTPISPLKE